MARLPDPSSTGRVAPAAQRGVAGYRTGQMESAVGELGQTISKMAQDEADHISKVQAQDAFNKLRQKQLELTAGDPLDKTTGSGGGYVHRKGGNVVNTSEGGKPFLDEYRERFQMESDALAGGLSGRARERFDQLAANAAIDFQTGLVRHNLREADAYDKEALQGTLAAEAAAAGAKWNDPAALALARDNTLNAVNDRIAREGTDPASAEAARKKALSGIHESVIDSALASGDAQYADQYLKANKEDLPAEAILQISNKVYAVRKNTAVAQAVGKVSSRLMPKIMPTDFDRLAAQVGIAESGGKQFNSKGEVVTSTVGAIGKMQIMPATGPEAAKLAGVEWDEKKFREDENYNETLGKAYLADMLRQFDGDLEKALYAYNAGPGTVREAVKKVEKLAKLAERDPNIKVPHFSELTRQSDANREQSRKYAAKIAKAYAAGSDPAEPNVLEVRKMAAEELLRAMPDARPDAVEAAQAKAERDFNDMRTAKNQDRNDLADQLRMKVDSGELRDFSDVSPSELAALGPKREEVRKYLESEAEQRAEADPVVVEMFQELSLDTQRLAQMTPTEIMGMAPDIGKKNAQKLLSKRESALQRPELAVTVDADMFKAEASAYGVKDKEDQVKLKDRVDEAISKAQSAGRALTRDDKRKIIRDLALELPVGKAGWFGGYDTKRVFEVTNPSEIAIPEKYKAEIVERAKEKGVTIRTDAQWREGLREILQDEKQKELSEG